MAQPRLVVVVGVIAGVVVAVVSFRIFCTGVPEFVHAHVLFDVFLQCSFPRSGNGERTNDAYGGWYCR